MNRRSVFAALCFAGIILISTTSIGAQTHLSVPIGDAAYHLLEVGELSGSITRLYYPEPKPKSMVNSYLEEMLLRRERLSRYEVTLARHYYSRFNNLEYGLLRHGNLVYNDKKDVSLVVGLDLLTNFRINTADPDAWHMHNQLRAYMMGDLGKRVSYMGAFGGLFDRLSPQAYPPYQFTNPGDIYYTGVDYGESAGAYGDPAFSAILQMDITGRYFSDDVLTVRMAKTHRDLGVGEGSLLLSETARPFIGVDIIFHPADWLYITQVMGSLGNYFEENKTRNNPNAVSHQKMFAAQKIHGHITDWYYLSFAYSAIWPKRFELGYMLPLVIPIFTQLMYGNVDNLLMEIETGFIVPPIGKFYAVLLIDEARLIFDPSYWFTAPRQMFAFQLGYKTKVPKLPLTTFTFQYTRIEPFTYAHYPQSYSLARNPIDLSYTHDGENLAYYLQPNSDEFLFQLKSMPIKNFLTSLTYKLIRHGTNEGWEDGDLAIYGDIDEYMNYSQLNNYPDKDFLNDGIYDYNNVIGLKGSYSFEKVPITVGLEYIFSHTHWVANDSGVTPPAPQIRNILSFTVEVYR